MSLALRGEVAAVAQRQWVGRIWYLKEAPDNLLRDVSQMLNAMVMAPRERGRRSGMKLRPRLSLSQVFAPKELCDLPATLYVVRRGVAAKNGMPMITGAICGTDFVCDDEAHMDLVAAVALTCESARASVPESRRTSPNLAAERALRCRALALSPATGTSR